MAIKAENIIEKRRREDFSAQLARTGWYHSIELPGRGTTQGYLSLDELRERWSQFPLPANMTGKSLLDIGTWDGWFAFEAERLGAEVVAIDNVEQETFQFAHKALGSAIRFEQAEVYDLIGMGLRPFDYVLFLGVLYHLRHPLLALETVCALTKDVAIVDSYVIEDDDRTPIPWMEFYETNELSNQIDNWTGPTLRCLTALCRSAGFARVELLGSKYGHARLACYRTWENPPDNPASPPPQLTSVANGRFGDYGINFSSSKEEFITCWFRSEEAGIQRDALRPEVSGFGTHALVLESRPDGLFSTSFQLPPGLSRGWHDVRIRTASSSWSNALQIAVDLAASSDHIEIGSLCDGLTWTSGEVRIPPDRNNGFVTLWLRGLPANADRNNVRVFCEEYRLAVEFVSPEGTDGARQINARISPLILTELGSGVKVIRVACGAANARSEITIATGVDQSS